MGMVNYNTTSLYDALWECKSLSLEFTLGGFNATILDPRLFQNGLNFANLTCQLVEYLIGPNGSKRGSSHLQN